MAAAGLAGWWFRGIRSGRKIDGLEAESKLANQRAAWAIELKDEAIKAIEAEKQFKDSKADIIASSGNDSLAERLVKVEAAVEKLSAANNAARSAIAVAIGKSEAVGISGSLSHTPLPSSAAQEMVVGMTTPQQRLDRMRKSFAKNKSVLTADYKYFTTPDAPAKPHGSIPRNKAGRKSAEQSAPKSPKQR